MIQTIIDLSIHGLLIVYLVYLGSLVFKMEQRIEKRIHEVEKQIIRLERQVWRK